MTEPAAAGGTEQGLTRVKAIPLAIGSVAGSGILFLPSAVYVAAGSNSLLVWGVATLLCLPMLLMFEDMVRANPDGRSIEAFIRLGLGDAFARCVPVMFLALVVVGLPAGAFVAGRYVTGGFGGGPAVVVTLAVAVLAGAVAANLAGVRTNVRVQGVTTWALVAVVAVLLASALPAAPARIDATVPDLSRLGPVLPTAVLAFWAFAGFENLTFLSREFRNPDRDFLPVSVIALGVYGLLTILLTVAIAVRIPLPEVDDLVGLLQLAGTIRPHRLVAGTVTVIAVAAMLLNAVAWVWGVSRLVARAAESRILPVALAVESGGVPRRSVLLLAGLFTGTCALLTASPDLIVEAIATASAIFILLYLLTILSYFRVRGLTVRALLNLLVFAVMATSLVQSGWRTFYGVTVLLAALAVNVARRRVERGQPRALSPAAGEEERP